MPLSYVQGVNRKCTKTKLETGQYPEDQYTMTKSCPWWISNLSRSSLKVDWNCTISLTVAAQENHYNKDAKISCLSLFLN